MDLLWGGGNPTGKTTRGPKKKSQWKGEKSKILEKKETSKVHRKSLRNFNKKSHGEELKKNEESAKVGKKNSPGQG